MSGTLRINKGSCWMPAGWAYNNVFEAMASQLADAPELAFLLLDNRPHLSVLLDISKMAPEQFQRLLRAAECVLAETIKAGASAFAQPEFFPGYEQRLKELIDMMRADPRAASG